MRGGHATECAWAKACGNRMFTLRRNGTYSGLIPSMRTGNGKSEDGYVMSARDVADLITTLTRELRFMAEADRPADAATGSTP